MMLPNPKQMIQLIRAKQADGVVSDVQPVQGPESEYSLALKAVAADILRAVEAKDAEALAQALQECHLLCEDKYENEEMSEDSY